MCQNVCDSVRPLYVLSKFTGYALYSVDTESFQVKFTTTDAAFATFNFFTALALNFLYWNSSFGINIEDAEIVNSFYLTAAYTNFVFYTSAKLWNFVHRHRFGELLRTIHEVDLELLILGVKFDYKKHQKFVWKMMILINFLHILTSIEFFVVQSIAGMNIENTAFFFTCSGFVSCLVLVNQFITSVCLVKERQKAINLIIK